MVASAVDVAASAFVELLRYNGKKMKNLEIKPNFIDKAFSYFAPVHGLRRLEARTRMALVGGYTGAKLDRRQTKAWRTADGSADNVTLPDLPILRERSRDLLRNAPLATGAVNTVVTNVVGTGLRVHSNIDREVLKPFMKTEEAFDKWEREAERIFRHWAESTNCDATRYQTFTELQNLIIRSCLESGDIFVVRRYIKRPNALLGLSLQLVEADRVANPNFQMDTSKLSGGVELDDNGAPVAYYIYKRFPGDYTEGSNEYVRVPAFSKDGERQVYHIMNRSRT